MRRQIVICVSGLIVLIIVSEIVLRVDIHPHVPHDFSSVYSSTDNWFHTLSTDKLLGQ
jgi:hypothetical protein